MSLMGFFTYMLLNIYLCVNKQITLWSGPCIDSFLRYEGLCSNKNVLQSKSNNEHIRNEQAREILQKEKRMIAMLLLAFFQRLGKFHFTISSLKFIKKRSGLNFIIYSFLEFRNDNTIFCWSPDFKSQPFRFPMRSSCWPVQNFISLNILWLLVNLTVEIKQPY